MNGSSLSPRPWMTVTELPPSCPSTSGSNGRGGFSAFSDMGRPTNSGRSAIRTSAGQPQALSSRIWRRTADAGMSCSPSTSRATRIGAMLSAQRCFGRSRTLSYTTTEADGMVSSPREARTSASRSAGASGTSIAGTRSSSASPTIRRGWRKTSIPCSHCIRRGGQRGTPLSAAPARPSIGTSQPAPSSAAGCGCGFSSSTGSQ